MTSETSTSTTRDRYDVVCVGGGGSGLAAAGAAAEAGARVLVLEKRGALGGNANMATGLFGSDSPVQERLNIVARSELYVRLAAEYAHWRVNLPLVRSFVERSGDTIAWLERLGVTFPWVTPLFETTVAPTWHVAEGGGSSVVRALAEHAREHGAGLVTGAAVTSVRSSGRAWEITWDTADGESHHATTAAVVIATGGYGGSEEMLREHVPGYDPDTWFCMGHPHRGDGIRFAHALGAAPEGLGLCELEAPGLRGPLVINLLLRHPSTLILNARGERYFDEGIVDNCFEAANALLRQPGHTAYGLLDSTTLQAVMASADNKLAGPLYSDQPNDPEVGARAVERLRPPRGRHCETLEEAAEFMGVEAAVLRAAVERYNEACRSGDRDFGKLTRHLRPVRVAPFTVVRGTVGFLNTIGGVRVSPRLEAVDENDVPLDGMYVVGADAGGWQGDTYNFQLAGSSLGFAVNSGRIAGESAARAARRSSVAS